MVTQVIHPPSYYCSIIRHSPLVIQYSIIYSFFFDQTVRFFWLAAFNTWILHVSEAFIGKATKGDVVDLYFKPLATQHMKASGSPEG
jgi:hypothetical protein